MSTGPSEDDLIRQAAAGDQGSWAELMGAHRARLHRLVALRIDQRIVARVAPSDVVQEAYLQAWRSLDKYLSNPQGPFYLWLRGIASNKLREVHRHHLGSQKRDAQLELPIHQAPAPAATSEALAAHLLGDASGPSEAAARAELRDRVKRALDGMDPIDREILALRHFEQLSPAEAAAVLGVQEKAAAMRYVRALRRLSDILGDLAGLLS